MLFIITLKEMHQVQQVCIIESAMLEAQEVFEVFVLVVQDELVRSVVHAGHQLRTLVDDSLALAPGQNRREEASYLNVLLLLKPMRYANGVIGNKLQRVVPLVPVF